MDLRRPALVKKRTIAPSPGGRDKPVVYEWDEDYRFLHEVLSKDKAWEDPLDSNIFKSVRMASETNKRSEDYGKRSRNRNFSKSPYRKERELCRSEKYEQRAQGRTFSDTSVRTREMKHDGYLTKRRDNKRSHRAEFTNRRKENKKHDIEDKYRYHSLSSRVLENRGTTPQEEQYARKSNLDCKRGRNQREKDKEASRRRSRSASPRARNRRRSESSSSQVASSSQSEELSSSMDLDN